jgi:hypothetical protein
MTQRSLILLLGTDRKPRVHRVSFSRNIFPGESDQRIAEERRHDIPTVYRQRIAPSTFVCADPGEATLDHGVVASCEATPNRANQTTLRLGCFAISRERDSRNLANLSRGLGNPSHQIHRRPSEAFHHKIHSANRDRRQSSASQAGGPAQHQSHRRTARFHRQPL